MNTQNQHTSSLIKKSSHLFIRLANSFLSAHAIPHGYTPFLLLLDKNPDLTQTDLYKMIGIEQPTAVKTLDRMEKDGFIRKSRSETDKRRIELTLTPKARKCKKAVNNCLDHINQTALKNLSTKEIKQLNILLGKIAQNLESALA